MASVAYVGREYRAGIAGCSFRLGRVKQGVRHLAGALLVGHACRDGCGDDYVFARFKEREQLAEMPSCSLDVIEYESIDASKH